MNGFTSMATAATTAGLLLLGTASPAVAADGGSALISLDGVTFSEAPEGSVFPTGVVLVPGSITSGTFWVRNDSDRPADLRISVSDTTASDGTFIENLSLRASTPATTDARAVPLEEGATCTPLLEGELMPPQSVTEVSIALAMRDSVGNDHQSATAGTTLMVTLSDPQAASPAADCTPGGGVPLAPKPDKPTQPTDPDDPTIPAGGNPDSGPAPRTGGPAAGSGSDGGSDGTDPDPAAGSPEPPTPPATAAPPSLAGGSPVLFPWMGLGAAVLGAGIVLGIRKRRGQRR